MGSDHTAPAANDAETLARLAASFEETVLAQKLVHPDRYDEAYFAAAWRAEGNRYDLETRRRIEARHPQLIKEVFDPGRILDVGCGPGFLMLFLHELGLDVRGVDVSPSSQRLAPDAVRDRISIGPVTALEEPDRSFDLVVCREVLEHLTVLELRKAVAEICRVSARFVYVTTRFHPHPAHLLDLTTEPDVDPTHITLLAKPFLRSLIVLEGFGRRPDLEDRLDWRGKRRVLVYERARIGNGSGE